MNNQNSTAGAYIHILMSGVIALDPNHEPSLHRTRSGRWGTGSINHINILAKELFRFRIH
jgi:hypothetical protein